MTKKQFQTMTNEELLSSLYWMGIRTSNEMNSKRGLTKQTEKEEGYLLQECVKRFGMNEELFKSRIYR